MKMRIVLLLFTILLVSCSKNKEQYARIKGVTVSENNNKNVMLFTFDENDSILSVDTTTVKNKSFTFKKKPYIKTLSVISIGNYPEPVYSGEFILESGDISIEMLKNSFEAKGTPINNSNKEYLKVGIRYANTIKKINKSDSTPNQNSMKDAQNELFNAIKKIFLNNKDNGLGRKIYIEQLNGIFQDKIYPLGTNQLKNDPQIIRLAEGIKKQREIKRRSLQLIGQKYRNFKCITKTGDTVNISQYLGSTDFELLDFWASWCGPCIAELPNLKKLDHQQKTWLNAITKHNLENWEQLRVVEPNKVKNSYFFEGIPHTVLISKDGNIEITGTRAEGVKTFLQQKNQQ